MIIREFLTRWIPTCPFVKNQNGNYAKGNIYFHGIQFSAVSANGAVQETVGGS
jgi:hypothetical protein